MGELIPPIIQPMLAEYRALIERDTFALVAGCYLHGSIALAAFDTTQSDIDFVALLHRPCTAEELERLAAIHKHLIQRYPQWQLEGSYLQAADVGQAAEAIAPYPTFHDGKFVAQGTFDINPVTWWLLKTKGIPLFGTPPAELPFTIKWETVRAYTLANLNSYWRRWAYDPRYNLTLFRDWAIQWSVLGILRLVYALRENELTSKIEAGDYGLRNLPSKWHRLIQEALRLRRQEPHSLYRFSVVRTFEAIQFLRMVVREHQDLS